MSKMELDNSTSSNISTNSIIEHISNLNEKELLDVLQHLQKMIYIPCIVSKTDFKNIVGKDVSNEQYNDVINNTSMTNKICNIVEYSLEICYSEADSDKN